MMNRHLEDIPPIIRHLSFIVLLFLFSAMGNWMMGNHWPSSASSTRKPATQVNPRTAQINAISVAEPVGKQQP